MGEVTAYFDGRDPEVAGERVKLSRREHAIFQHLALNAHRVISKAAIYDAVYGMADDQPFDKVIDVYICKIRKKIDASRRHRPPVHRDGLRPRLQVRRRRTGPRTDRRADGAAPCAPTRPRCRG